MPVPVSSYPLVVGSVYRFRLLAKRDGVVWNLTGATVELLLKSPANVTAAYTATLSNATEGTADYTCSTSNMATVGNWRRSWRVTLADGTVMRSRSILFAVEASP